MIDLIPDSPEWDQAWREMRHGKITSTGIKDIGARTKSGWGASRANYRAKLVAERLSGQMAEGYQSPEMLRGKQVEPLARAAYEWYKNVKIERVLFVDHPTIPNCGASPDGYVGADGAVEFKCPNTATHISYIRRDEVDPDYIPQVNWTLECSGRKWIDWCSFDDRLPERMRLFVKRVYRNETLLADYRALIAGFTAELDADLAMLKEKFGEP